jgi:hypothetical protein
MDNAAFENTSELPKILKSIAAKRITVRDGKVKVRDTNGNTVGFFEIVEE